MVFVAGLSYRYLVWVSVTMIPLLYLVLMSAEYRRRRLLAFLDPWDDPFGDGFQLIQSQIAVGTGGVFGKGLMGSVQKLSYLPYPHTDFIYAVISEETGLIGATIVLLCFCVIAWRGLRVAALAPDRFGSLVAVGLTTMVSLQAFINISVVLGLMPTKGIPLPFVSMGGSSLLVNLLGHGCVAEYFTTCFLRHLRFNSGWEINARNGNKDSECNVCRRWHWRASVSWYCSCS